MTAITTSRYAERFAELKTSGKKAFIPFTILGWPDRERSKAIIQALIDGGASALELGFAFSDPAADGPTIQQAATETLETGFCVDDALSLIAEIRAENPDLPIGLLVYYNLVLARGIEQFFVDVAKAGVDGVLIADLPPETAAEVLPAARANNIDLIFIVSTLTNEARLSQISTMAGGFLYVVSRLGITGTEERYDPALKDLLERLKTKSALPACVGFGISTREHARAMADLGADGVIVGSAVLQNCRKLWAEASQDWQEKLSAWAREICL